MLGRDWLHYGSRLSVAICMTMLLAGCDGNSGFTPISSDTGSVTHYGRVVQGPVRNATVCADYNWNFICEPDEPTTETDDQGNYNLNFTDPRGGYRLVSVGGIDTLTGDPAYMVAAPAEANNITPLTTLVAMASTPEEGYTVMAAIEDLGVSYDMDFSADTGVDPNLLSVVKTVEVCVETFADLGFTAQADLEQVYQAITDELIAQTIADQVNFSLADNTSLGDLSGNAATTVAESFANQYDTFSIEATALDEFDTLLTNQVITLANNIDTLAADSTDGTVTEAAAQTEADSTQDQVANAIATDSLVDSVSLVVDGLYADTALLPATGTITVDSANLTQVSCVFAPTSDFDVPNTFDQAQVTVRVRDLANQREVSFVIDGVSLTIDAAASPSLAQNVNITAFDTTAATLTVSAKNSDGTMVVTSPVSGPFETVEAGVSFIDNSITLNVAATRDLLSAQVAADFTTLLETGNFEVIFSAAGVPMESQVRYLTVQ